MPLFKYKCSKCENIFEVLVLNNNSLVCPNCNSNDIIKYVGHSSFILKGSRWAKDGYSDSTKHDNFKGIARVPEYADRKTDKKLGFGKPEIV